VKSASVVEETLLPSDTTPSGATLVHAAARFATLTLPHPEPRSYPLPALNPVDPPLGQFVDPVVAGHRVVARGHIVEDRAALLAMVAPAL